jgi:hypothetical protein
MRVDLRDGMWAELREEPSHAQVNLIRRALLRATDESEAAADVAAAYIAAYVSAWSVRTKSGLEIPLERAVDAPDDIIERVASEAAQLYAGKPDPKGSPAPSEPSEQASA